MAPSLKEVDTGCPAAAVVSTAGQGPIAEASIPAVVSSCDNSNDAPTNSDNDAPNLAGATSAATSQQKAASLPPIEREDPSEIPDDETAFLVAPHFTRKNPFHRDLAAFDNTLRCPICGQLYDKPVSLLPCLHDFCSLCVRSHLKSTYTGMKRKADCPVCNEPVKFGSSSDYEKGILPNRPLQQRVDAYQKCRGGLRESLVRLDVLEKEKAQGILAQSRGEGGESGSKRGGDKGRGGRGARSSKRARRATSANPTYASDASELESDDDYQDDDGEDRDDSSDSEMPSAPSGKPAGNAITLKHKPTVNYHNLNKKKLKALCEKEGLSTDGNDAALKKRHSEFITLYNSECDSGHPRTVDALRRELKSREKAIAKEANDTKQKRESKYMKNLGSSLGQYHEGSIAKPTTGNAGFDTLMNANFARMVADVKERDGKLPSNGDKNEGAVKSNGDVHECGSDSGRGVAATSPAASIDSDETVETPAASRRQNDRKGKGTPPKSKTATAAKRASAKKPKSGSRSARSAPRITRVSILGPWTCRACTFENTSNVAKKTVCEMCRTPRPTDRPAEDVEVVNIDC